MEDSASSTRSSSVADESTVTEFHEPNLGFKSLLSRWKDQDQAVTAAEGGEAAIASNQSTGVVGIAVKRKTRDEAKQEYMERKKSATGDQEAAAAAAAVATSGGGGGGKQERQASTDQKEKKTITRVHLRNVYQQPLPANVEEIKTHKSQKNLLENELILSALSKNFVFSDLDRQSLAPLVEAFELCSFERGDVIIKQGDPGDYFYLIKSGKVTFQVNGNDVGTAKKGASFGELSLLYTCPRAATVIAADASTLFRVDQNTFRYILQSQTQKSEKGKVSLVENVDFLKNLTSLDIRKLSAVMTPRVFSEGDLLVRKGDAGDAFYIVQEGHVLVKDISVGSTVYEDQTLGPGEYFGERSLVTSEPRAANVVATSKGVAFSIDRATFEKVLGKMSDVIMRAQDARRLAGVARLKKAELSGRQIASLAAHMVDRKFRAGETIMAEGKETESALYFVRDGKVELSENGSVNSVIQLGGFFGEPTFGDARTAKAPYTAKVLEDCVCGVLTVAESKGIFDTSLLSDQMDVDMMESISDLHVAVTTDAQLGDLQKHRILGEGTFGQVWLVSEPLTDGSRRPYALKIQSKYDLAQEGQINAVVQEKNIMSQMQHPFIIKLVNTYQDRDFVFILLEMVQGGELFSVLHADLETAGLPEAQSKFYTLGIADALAYMHRSKFVYRDLKPENIMIDRQGYPVLIDFGFAKFVADKTYTLCGTPGFLPPEVVMTRGHNASADHWSLGILIFELITGENPFFYEGMDQMSLFQAIVVEDYDDPAGASAEAHDIVRKLLVKDPTHRLGSLARGERDILEHPFFSDLDLRAMHRRESPAPWIPNIEDPLDTSNFDDWSHLEDRTTVKYDMIDGKDAALFEGF